MATKTIKVSDLTGKEIGPEENLARIVVEDHPSITDSVTLEVLPEEVENRLPEEQNFVRVTYYPPSANGGEEKTLVLSVEEFNNLSTDWDMEIILQEALKEQQEREKSQRGRGGRRAAGDKGPKVDYSSPEHAGEPHRGKARDKEKEYVRNNLEEVNTRLSEQGMRLIDPNDPKMAERYGLTGEN
jgi:hypothetical protein